MALKASDSLAILLSFIFVVSTSVYFYFKLKKKSSKKRRLRDPHTINAERNVEFSDCNPLLKEHSNEFKREIVELFGGEIRVAVGFGLANCILLEGVDGCVVIDTLESLDAAEGVLDAFSFITDRKPVKAIILTHFHTDHYNGAPAFLLRFPDAKVYSHKTLSDMQNESRIFITVKRSAYQFGYMLPKGEHENSGIGDSLDVTPVTKIGYSVRPTEVFDSEYALNVAGMELKLIHAPGETDDQIAVWWPKHKALFPADNVYKSFPNLYAIRGTMDRDTLQWADTIANKLSPLGAKVLVPQHGRPVEGETFIKDLLIDYGDAIRFVHDQTVRLMNQGLSINEIANSIKLPSESHPFLQEFYGTVEWSSRAIFHHYAGWFTGGENVADLSSPFDDGNQIIKEKAKVDLFAEAIKARDAGKLQWAVELCDILGDEDSENVRELRSECLRRLAQKEKSANGRNWFFTAALENDGARIGPTKTQTRHMINSLKPAVRLFENFPLLVDASACPETEEIAHFFFTDTNEDVTLKLRRGACWVSASKPRDSEAANVTITTTTKIWRKILTRELNPLWANVTFKLRVSPNIYFLYKFISCFDFRGLA